MTAWSGIHTVQAILSGAAVTAEALHMKLTGTLSADAGVAAIVLTAILAGVSFYSNAVFGPAAKEVNELRAMAVKR